MNSKQIIELNRILSIQSQRTINNDYTIRFKNNYYQLANVQPTTVIKKDIVLLEEHLNGELKIALRNHYLDYARLPNRPPKEIDIKLLALTNRQPSDWKPPINHPWRKQFLINKKQSVLTAA